MIYYKTGLDLILRMKTIGSHVLGDITRKLYRICSI